MEIIKLGDVIVAQTGNFNKIDAIENGKYNFYVRSEKILRSDLYTFNGEGVIIPGEGIFKPLFAKGKFAVHQRVYFIKPKVDFIKTKYLYYWFVKNIDFITSQATGSTVKSLRLPMFYKPKINLPHINVQQQIIDIIEPKENLFIKYNNLVDIGTLDEFKKDWKVIIDIIEPFEKIRESINLKLDKILNFLKKISEIKNGKKEYKFSNLVHITKNKIKNHKCLLDLSVLKNDSLIIDKLSDSNKFKTNIFSCSCGDVFISSIRPNLKKYGIIPLDMNILGTIYNFKIKDWSDRGLVLLTIISDNFLNYQIGRQHGTKMPVISKENILNYNFFTNNFIEKNRMIFNKLFDLIIEYNKKLLLLNKIIDNLIEIHIK